ncbi:MAG: septation protein IspZ [Burkholderiales bacterium]
MTPPVLLVMALALAWWWRPRQTSSPAAWIMLAAFMVLGGVALWFVREGIPQEDYPTFMHWKPTVLYWTMCVIFLGAAFLHWDYPVKWVIGSSLPLASREWKWLNMVLALLYLLLGGVNLLLVYTVEEANWVGFKESCYVNIMMIVLVRINFVWLPILKNVAELTYRFVQRLRHP